MIKLNTKLLTNEKLITFFAVIVGVAMYFIDPPYDGKITAVLGTLGIIHLTMLIKNSLCKELLNDEKFKAFLAEAFAVIMYYAPAPWDALITGALGALGFTNLVVDESENLKK